MDARQGRARQGGRKGPGNGWNLTLLHLGYGLLHDMALLGSGPKKPSKKCSRFVVVVVVVGAKRKKGGEFSENPIPLTPPGFLGPDKVSGHFCISVVLAFPFHLRAVFPFLKSFGREAS